MIRLAPDIGGGWLMHMLVQLQQLDQRVGLGVALLAFAPVLFLTGLGLRWLWLRAPGALIALLMVVLTLAVLAVSR